MTIIQLEYLLAVANCGSFSLAAEHCFVTQPSLSMQVKALEEELGVVLPDRSGRRGAGACPRNAAGLQQHPRIGGRTQGRDVGQTPAGRHSDHRPVPAAQIHPRFRARLSQSRTGDFRDDHFRHRRGPQARPYRRGAGGQRHLRRGDSGAGTLQRPFLRIRFARKRPLRALKHPHRGHRPA